MLLLFYYANEVLNHVDHPKDLGGSLVLNHLVHLLKTQGTERELLISWALDATTHLLDTNLCHCVIPFSCGSLTLKDSLDRDTTMTSHRQWVAHLAECFDGSLDEVVWVG